jgi:hypothetical protein
MIVVTETQSGGGGGVLMAVVTVQGTVFWCVMLITSERARLFDGPYYFLLQDRKAVQT